MTMSDLYLIDTNYAPAPWDKKDMHHDKVRRFLESIGESSVAISVVTLAEIEYGIKIAPEMDENRKSIVRASMAEYTYVLDITKHTVRFYSEIRAKLFAKYAPSVVKGRLKMKFIEDLVDRTTAKTLGVQENDVWIAAQACERNACLVTEDRMAHIASLQLDPPLRIMRIDEI